ncbi:MULTISPECIES: hypothetical protein [Winogradskyella]|uniref:STAS/SEC14 domain-containing protein n=1 Tax=Winogradskyella ouciana TaxID=2608631 RepID=A0A7K1G890_9FLAO|nr:MULTISPECIES: hypothetical protein [Winogradskyella]MBO6880165.1 hypothetical protein [Winogradskyella sp.]MTE25373.1 hypothetical protein [Winogradskyella ouciana]
MGIIKYLSTEDTECFIFDDFLINQIKEGVVVEPKHNEDLNKIIKEHFSGKNMVYVSNRVKSYSVNPLIYAETEAIPNLVAIAMIPKTDVMRKNAEYERNFFDKPYEIFDTLTEAMTWVQSILEKESSQQTADKS